jgi:hypothetical protein
MVKTWQEILLYGVQMILAHGPSVEAEQKNI